MLAARQELEELRDFGDRRGRHVQEILGQVGNLAISRNAYGSRRLIWRCQDRITEARVADDQAEAAGRLDLRQGP